MGRAPNPPLVAGLMQRLMKTLPRLWRQETTWENTHKEECLRLDVIPLLGNSHMRRARFCEVKMRTEARARRGIRHESTARANLWLV